MGKSYSANSNDYKLLEEVGYGASATVFRAIYLPYNEVVAVKCLDLDRCHSNLDDIRREAQTMSLIDHPNVIKAFCSFVVDRNLWVVMPFMAEGSCLHLMKIAYQEGFEESAIGSILKETLKALEYLHHHGHIHRDVKAGNILMDTDGEVKLADFGVSACMFDRGDRQRSRNTFVGTPCWMAPEVLQPGTGYDFKADIWSFGITALELAHGHAPFSKYPPMKVLLMTIQNAPPGLDYDRDKRFSKSFKEMVAMCLVKDQTKRPTAEKLSKHSFFKNAKPPELIVKKLFVDLPPLWKRVKDLQIKDAAQLALKKMPSAEQEAISQSEYQRGVSAWNFDVEDLKFQASLLQDEDEIKEIQEEEDSIKFNMNQKSASDSVPKPVVHNIVSERINGDEVLVVESQTNKGQTSESDMREYDTNAKTDTMKSESKSELAASLVEKEGVQAKTRNQTGRARQTQSGPLVPGMVLSNSLSERARNFERYENDSYLGAEKSQQVRRAPSFSGPLNLPNRASANSLSAPIKSSGGFKDTLEDKSKTNLVQIKGRFSVTSENVDLVKDIPLSTVSRRNSQGSPLRKSASVGNWIFDSKQMPQSQPPKEISNSNGLASVLIPHLHNLFQQTSVQQDLIANLLSSLQTVDVENAPQNGKLPPLPRGSDTNGSAESIVSEREKMLLMKISELQARMNSLTDELTSERLKYVQLQQRLNAVPTHEEDEDRRGGDS
ncbi:STE20/SPS1-related proline-alanine-rich protein kinase-like isoform X2 [Salvia splendens]|uniref:STE20/SPS1-related proline-alanine-rich protein kinase-like isoform X2 n=1 Tax=Salvia splendens TaxID=180675 RepID=UPI001C25D9BD|nr:STE20/SPS1-related proline-alanine-rich protein kinase-like isoform X2 [Salvia splendens]